MTLPRDFVHSPSMETIGVVAFCHGFKITDEFFLYREIGLCSRDGYHHLLLSYSPGRDLSTFSNETQMSIDEQIKYDHVKGLGLDWVPDNCDGKCKIVQYIFEREITDPRWEFSYEDELPECMRKLAIKV